MNGGSWLTGFPVSRYLRCLAATVELWGVTDTTAAQVEKDGRISLIFFRAGVFSMANRAFTWE
jgi:hypothetical protein